MIRKFGRALCVALSGLAGGALAQVAIGPSGPGFVGKAYAVVTSLFQSTGTLAISGGAANPNNLLQYESVTASGSSTDALQGVNYWYLRDQANAGANELSGLLLRQQYGGGASAGNRFGLMSYFSVDQQPNAGDPSIQNYTAATMQSYGAVPTQAGLTGGVGYGATQYAGSLWGTDDNVWLASGGTNWQYLAGHEIGVAVYTGASVADRWGLAIYGGGNLTGNMDDAGIQISSGNTGGVTTANFKTGLQFGGLRHDWGIQPSGTIIGATARSYGGTGTPSALYGLDFSAVNFAAGGSPIVMPQITPASSSATCKAGAIEWDASYIYVCTVANTFKRTALTSF